MQRTTLILSRGLLLLIICSIRMYRQRIKDWGLDKNHKDREMKAIVRKHEGRVAKGKASTFRIRGRNIDYQDVLRYLKRKNMSTEAVIALRSMSKTPEAVECLTPLPSPVRTPEVLAVPERIFRMLRDYHQGSLEAGTWRSDGEDGFCETTKVSRDEYGWISTLFDQCMLALTLMKSSAFEEATCELDRVCASIEKVVHAEEPTTFATLLRIIIRAHRCPWPEVGLDILRHMSAMGGIMLGDQHPFKLICGWLASRDIFDHRCGDDILIRSLKAIYETFKLHLGHLHWTTIYSLLEHFEMVRISDQSTDHQESGLRNLLHECETALGQDDARTLQVRLGLGVYYFGRCEYTAACEQAKAVLARNTSKHCQLRGLKMLAWSLHRLGEIHKAFNTLGQAIDLAIAAWGAADSENQEMMLRLESWMLKQSMPESAAKVREERLRSRNEDVDWDANNMDMSYNFDAELIKRELQHSLA